MVPQILGNPQMGYGALPSFQSFSDRLCFVRWLGGAARVAGAATALVRRLAMQHRYCHPYGNMGGNIGIMGLYRDNGKENGNYI